MKKRIRIIYGIVFSLVLISTVLALGSFNLEDDKLEDNKPIIIKTPSTDKTCLNGVCNLVLYSGIRNVYEDETWKRVENARSLKDKGFRVVYLENDSDFKLIVEDFNMTFMNMTLDFAGNPEDYPTFCQVTDELNAKCDFKLDEKWEEFDETTGEIIEKSQLKFQYKWEMKQGEVIKGDKVKYEYKGNPLGKKYTFGGHSTTIKLQEADTENLDDALLDEYSPTVNYGDYMYMYQRIRAVGGYRRWAIVKFNIFSLPNGATIHNSSLCWYMNLETLDVGEGLDTANHHSTNQMWSEEDITWDTMPSYNSTAEEKKSWVDGSPVGWYFYNATQGVTDDYDNNRDNTTFLMVTSNVQGTPGTSDYIRYWGKEYPDDASLRPYLNITYTLPPDTTPPTYSNNKTNTTIAGAPVNFSIYYDDDTALHPNGLWVFSTNNTGSWANESAKNFTATPQWANVTKVLNAVEGTVVGYRWYANDTAGNENHSLVYKVITTSADTCTYSSGEWNVDCSDNCVVSTNTSLGGNNLTLTGTGIFILNAQVRNFDKVNIYDGCEVRIYPLGSLRGN